MSDPQNFSHWPSWPLPIHGLDIAISAKHPCGYLPGRLSTFRWFDASERGVSAEEYQRLMDSGLRRSGTMIYQPMCTGCRACIPLRVPLHSFVPTKSQRRALRKNADIIVTTGSPKPTREKWELYQHYLMEWHHKPAGEEDIASFLSFLYMSPVETVEFEYRTAGGKLLGVGLCDLCPASLSSVYFYFDPREAQRSLGTFSALYEIQWAREHGLKHWYAGYWVKGCASMEYKARFRPCEVLGTDGVWRPIGISRH